MNFSLIRLEKEAKRLRWVGVWAHERGNQVMPRIPLRPDVHGHGGSHVLHFHIRLHQWQPFQTLQSHRRERQRMQRFIVDEANQKKKGAKLGTYRNGLNIMLHFRLILKYCKKIFILSHFITYLVSNFILASSFLLLLIIFFWRLPFAQYLKTLSLLSKSLYQSLFEPLPNYRGT